MKDKPQISKCFNVFQTFLVCLGELNLFKHMSVRSVRSAHADAQLMERIDEFHLEVKL